MMQAVQPALHLLGAGHFAPQGERNPKEPTKPASKNCQEHAA
jgi:hypothetical protein